MKTLIFTILIASAAFFTSEKSFSYPRFAAYTGDKCIDCHVNPTGGMMRNEDGIAGAKKFLNMKMFEKLNAKMEFNPKVNENISIGGDIRMVAAKNQVEGGPEFNSFLTMQGDVYVNAQVNDVINIFLTSGIDIPNFPTQYEVFGLISNLPAGLYFKAGRFKPNFGIRIPEHRAYQRQLLLGEPYFVDDGIEIGISPSFLNFNFSVLNGRTAGFFDTDSKKMIVAYTDFTFNLDQQRMYNVNFGASFYNDPYDKFNAGERYSANRKAWNFFTKIGLLRQIALLGEIDFDENKDMLAANPFTRGRTYFGELDVRVVQGFELRAQYEMRDPDRTVETDDFSRISFGFTAFPIFGLETEVFYRIVNEDADIENNEIQWSTHFYF